MFDILRFQKQTKNIVTEVILTRNLCTLKIYGALVQINKNKNGRRKECKRIGSRHQLTA